MPEEKRLRSAIPEDGQYVESVLRNNDLVTADLPGKLGCLFIFESEERRLGVGGFEKYGGISLLRSVAIEQAYQGQGFGTELCDKLLGKLRANGTRECYLLTDTAEGFFRNQGFSQVNRGGVPRPIQNTGEFEELCPESSTCMKHIINDNSGNGNGE